MEFIATKNALKPSGHYSQAIVHNGVMYISGQLPIDPETGEKVHGTIEEETARVLGNLELILREAGSSKENVLKVTLYIPDISLWDNVNKVYSDFFGSHKPARSVVPTKELHYGFKIEIEAIAAVDGKGVRCNG
ncbi:MAG: RidA family protein [Caulobacteraceae bacterium]